MRRRQLRRNLCIAAAKVSDNAKLALLAAQPGDGDVDGVRAPAVGLRAKAFMVCIEERWVVLHNECKRSLACSTCTITAHTTACSTATAQVSVFVAGETSVLSGFLPDRETAICYKCCKGLNGHRNGGEQNDHTCIIEYALAPSVVYSCSFSMRKRPPCN